MSRAAITADQVFHALGDPTRRAIVERLAQGPASISGLAQPLGFTLTAIAQHLQVLCDCGLARTEKVGRVRTCSLQTAGFTVMEDWIAERRATLEQQLDRLGDFLAQEDDG
ncbi:MAG: helix-turn-helix transcriptional regulator [Caulobacterales bacterium]|nr:helix-turn-helix transcriptional regulator [Caulobacterales bacterium]